MILNHVSKTYFVRNQHLPVMQDFSLQMNPGSITAFVGPSGCGKTTLLRLIGGLEEPDSGTIEKTEAEQGAFSYLFQEPRLLPWHSVVANVELVLLPWFSNKGERIARAMEFLDMVGLREFAKFKPDQLSGGMRQRVSIARAFAYPGRIMLLDEPFQSLDTHLRWSLVESFLSLWEADRRTTVYVTHDLSEALLMADLVVRLTDRPMHTISLHPITTPRESRSLADPEFVELQRTFYT
ncbi:MAG TPA: ABC transporter ATP-binding protein [Sphaerochaetaceae bacterium]|nr:ABC transporter ATP-binding protein [Sphaerochaetaceae bacterium]